MTTLRDILPSDYERLAAISAAIDPADSRGLEWFRERDARRSPQLRLYRLVAERDGLVVGWGEVGQGWWAYHPRKFYLRLNVDPEFQRQGVGSCLYTALIDHVCANWNPSRVSAEASELRPWSCAFLEHRGFQEVQRRWDAALQVAEARLDRLPAAIRRVADSGVRITTVEQERTVRGDQFDQDLHAVEQRIYLDEPGYDPEGSLQFDQFRDFELNPKTRVDAGSFLALDGTRLVGVSRLRRDARGEGILHVGFTGVEAEYRGRGIALALKLLTLEYARDAGFLEIRTENDSTNAPMLHINLELGFRLEPASLIFHKKF